MPKQIIQMRQTKATRKGKQQTPRVDWDNPNPRLQYDIFKGFGNPLPGNAKPEEKSS